MKYILIILSFVAFTLNAQPTTNRVSLKRGIEKCLDGVGNPVENCFVTTDINGEQMYIDSATMVSLIGGGITDHGALTGLSDDDHDQYALLAGRTTGQILIGGTTTAADLTLQTTSGVGASGADMHMKVGNNGATEAMTILNDGKVGINQTAPIDQLVIGGNTYIGANETVLPYSTYGVQANRFVQIFQGSSVNNSNQNFADILFTHDLTAVTGDKIMGGFKFVNKSSGSPTEKRLAQFFCWAEGAVNKGAMSFYTNDGSTLAERLRINNTGLIGIGISASIAARLHVVSTTEQIRTGYNTTNYFSSTVASNGATTFNSVGSGSAFTFSDPVSVTGALSSTSTVTGTNIISTATVRLKGYTVGTLPAGVQGDCAFVTDATAPTFMGIAVGGGAVVAKVFYDGTNWITQ